MKKSVTLILCLLIMTATPACRQNNTMSDYNYRKACDAIYDDKDNEKALEYVNKQIEETPKHADSYYIRAGIYYVQEKYDSSLRDIASALKYHNSKSQVLKSNLYSFRGKIYADLGRDEDAILEYQKAVKYAKSDDKEQIQDYKFDLANAYYNSGQLSKSEKVYIDMLKDDSADCAAMVGLARQCLKLEKYDEGLQWCAKAESYNASYSQIYRIKMQILDKLGKTDECVDTAIKYFETESDPSLEFVAEYVGKHYTYGVAKTKEMINKNPGDYAWNILLAILYQNHFDNKNALEQYNIMEKEYGEYHGVFFCKSICYQELGQFDKAIKEVTKAIEKSGDNSYVGKRGDIYRYAGRYDEAIADYRKMSEEDPTDGYYYYAIGWTCELKGDKKTALDYYNQGIDIDKSYTYLYVSRGDLVKELGRIEDAKADYERAMELDTEVDRESCRQFALVGLGRGDEAIEWMDRIIEKYPLDYRCYYDRACICARLGRIAEGMNSLETAMEKGYRRFSHINNDHDLDPLRNLPEFKALIKKYQAIHRQELEELEADAYWNID